MSDTSRRLQQDHELCTESIGLESYELLDVWINRNLVSRTTGDFTHADWIRIPPQSYGGIHLQMEDETAFVEKTGTIWAQTVVAALSGTCRDGQTLLSLASFSLA